MIGSIVLGMSLVFGACGNQEGSSGESANEITVSTWNYETTPEFKALFEAFEKKTGIKVKAVDIASDDYDTETYYDAFFWRHDRCIDDEKSFVVFKLCFTRSVSRSNRTN